MEDLGSFPRPAFDHSLQDVGEDKRGLWAEDLLRLREPRLEDHPFTVQDLFDRVGLGPETAADEDPIRRRHVQEAHFRDSQCQRVLWAEAALDSETASRLDHRSDPDPLDQLDGDDIDRVL